mgnify:CR=1 FL=1
MYKHTKEKSNNIYTILNATLSSIKSVIPVQSQIKKPKLLKDDFSLKYGVLIGILGDMNGKLVISGDAKTFALIGKGMYGVQLEDEMLRSFSGELGNMIAGGISTNLAKSNKEIMITTPTILQGNTKISGYKEAFELSVELVQIGMMDTYLLLDDK